MKNTVLRHLMVPVLLLSLAGAAPAQEVAQNQAPEAAPAAGQADPQDAGAVPEVPSAMAERLRELQRKDPAGFRDLLRRSLSARLIWAARGEPLPPDFPVELAGRMTGELR